MKLFILTLFILIATLHAGTKPSIKGYPYFKQFKTKDYNAGPQNWAIAQNSQGLIYVANNNGVLEYDGLNWKLINIPGIEDVEALYIDKNDRIYLGGMNTFGYLSKDASAEFKFTCPSDSLEKNFGDIWYISSFGDTVLFIAPGDIFSYVKGKVSRFKYKKGIFDCFKKGQENLILSGDSKFLKISGDSLKVVYESKALKKIVPACVRNLPGSKETLFILSYSGLYRFNGQTYSKIPSVVEKLLKKNYIYNMMFLPDTTIAILLDPFGVAVVDTSGNLIYEFDINSSLIEFAPLCMFVDKEKGFWIGLNHGLVRYQYPSSLYHLSSQAGLRGGVSDLTFFDDKLYIATFNKIYVLDPQKRIEHPEESDLTKRFGLAAVENSLGWCWGFCKNNGNLWAVTDKGILLINDKKAVPVMLKNGNTTAFCPSKIFKNIYYISTLDSLFVFKKEKNSYKKKASILLQDQINTIVENADSTLWVDLYSSGFAHINLKNGFDSLKLNIFSSKDGLPSNAGNILAEVHGELFFLTEKGLYQPDMLKGRFYADTLSDLSRIIKKRLLIGMYSDKNGNYYACGKDSLLVLQKTTHGYKKAPYLFSELYKDPVYAIEEGPKGNLWIGTDNGLFQYLPATVSKTTNFVTLLRSVKIKGNSSVSLPAKGSSLILPYSKNTITFDFTATNYNHQEMNNYRFFLEGFDDDWSEWSQISQKEYTNLKEGTYTFWVQSKNYQNVSGKNAVFHFEILPPWYRTWWAYISYLSAFYLVIFLIIKWRSSTLQKLVDIRTKELQRKTEETELQAGELKVKNVQLQKAKDEAERATRAKSSFLANMSHEIRTPLNGILGMNELMIQTQLNNEQKDYANVIRDSANSLLEIISEVLDLSKIETGNFEFESIDFNLYDLLDKIKASFSYKIRQKDLEFITNFAPYMPQTVTGDPLRIQQIIINLLGNALKFTQTGFIKFEVKSVKMGADKQRFYFRVSDSGIGISSENLNKIFESFKQADSSTTREYGGSGLGLTISKDLATLMNGSIEVHSTPGNGAVFTLILDLSVQGEVKSREVIPSRHKCNLSPGIKILVVEDNAINRKVILRMLQNMGAVTDFAENGLLAVNKIKEIEYDIILMDIQMPVMDGLKATSEIKKHFDNNNHKTPIIALTANAIKGDREKYLDAGMDDYISKPVKQTELQQIISRVYNKN